MYKTVDEAFKEVQANELFGTDDTVFKPFEESQSFLILSTICLTANPFDRLLVIAAASFEAGRLYGRAQLIEEIGMGVKENAST